MQITHLGHSCVLIEAAGERVLLDPGTLSDLAAVRDVGTILVTHQHADHLDPAALPQLLATNPGAQLWLEPGAADALVRAHPDLGERVDRMRSDSVLVRGGLTLTPVGRQHAVVHDHLPRVGNLGVVVSAPDEPTLFHPGDALDAEHEALAELDLLCVPVNAPWARVADTLAFVRRLAPGRVVPIHDGLLSSAGRQTYLGHISGFGAEGGIEVVEVRDQGVVTV